MNLQQRAEQAFEDLIVEDTTAAVSLITAIFVGLLVELVERNGGDSEKPIHIDGGLRRDVTIHSPKSPRRLDS